MAGAKREIDRFKVKPSGIFAGWFSARVMVDEDGIVTEEPVPGEPVMGQNCISLYKKNDRRYTNGTLMTEFCNLGTHTNYRIYAQDCSPYAYVQTDLNAPKCGYMEPLPEPAVPPNPFGVANYGLYREISACDNKGVPIKLEIYRRNFAGAKSTLKSFGAKPITISWKNKEDDKFGRIRATDCTIELISSFDFELQQFYTEDQREFRVHVIKGGALKFKGYLMPTDSSEEFTAAPYTVSLKCTDGLGALKQISYPVPIGSSINIRQNFVEILAYCLALTNLDLDIITGANLYAIGMPNGIDDDPLAMAYVNPLRMSKSGVIMNCYEILDYICAQFGALLVQENGTWKFIRQSELSNPVIRTRRYNYKGLFLYSEQFKNLRAAACKNEDDISILDDSPFMRTGSPYKRVEVKTKFGDVPAIIYNGDFELWDGQNFNYWTRFGGINVTQTEVMLTTTTGEFPTGNHAMLFNERANSGKWIEAAPIAALLGDKLTLSYSVSRTKDTQTIAFPKPGYLFKMRIKIGEYYLTNTDDEYKWVTQLATVTNFVNNSKGDISNFNISFDLPDIPTGGNLIIQLYGFQKVEQVKTAGGRPGSADPNNPASTDYPYAEVTDYNPIYIDKFSIQKRKSEDKKQIDSILSISQQDGFYTTVPDQIELLFGDYAEQLIISATGQVSTRPSRAATSNGGVPPANLTPDLYAIYYNNAFTTGWYEYGKTATGLPIGLMLAKAIMKAYQRPFRFLSSSFLGANFSYLDVFNVHLPNNESFKKRVFALLSADYDIFKNELNNAEYVEIFEKDAVTIDITVPAYPGDQTSPIIQNPNPPVPTDAGIFTDEFTPEFK